MIGFIYFLKNPLTQEIFYIGATKTSLLCRLRTHYQHLREYQKGLRKHNKRYEYLEKMSCKAEIHLLEIVEDVSFLNAYEGMYIGLFKSWGFVLMNQTDGGTGGATYKHLTAVRKAQYKLLFQKKLGGKKQPKELVERWSVQKKGLGNPRAGTSTYFPVSCYKQDILVKTFDYPFEINDFLNKKDAYSNVLKILKGKKGKPYGYEWKQHKI